MKESEVFGRTIKFLNYINTLSSAERNEVFKILENIESYGPYLSKQYEAQKIASVVLGKDFSEEIFIRMYKNSLDKRVADLRVVEIIEASGPYDAQSGELIVLSPKRLGLPSAMEYTAFLAEAERHNYKPCHAGFALEFALDPKHALETKEILEELKKDIIPSVSSKKQIVRFALEGGVDGGMVKNLALNIENDIVVLSVEEFSEKHIPVHSSDLWVFRKASS